MNIWPYIIFALCCILHSIMSALPNYPFILAKAPIQGLFIPVMIGYSVCKILQGISKEA